MVVFAGILDCGGALFTAASCCIIGQKVKLFMLKRL